MPCAHFVRFREDENDRLHTAAKFRGKTIQGYLRDIAIDHIAKDCAAAKAAREERRGGKAEAGPAPAGFGIRDRIGRPEERRQAPPDDAPAPAPTQVIINTGAAAAKVDLAFLARFVCRGDPDERRNRLRQACREIADAEPDAAARAAAAKELDAKIAAIDGEPRDFFERVKAKLPALPDWINGDWIK